MGWAKGRPRPKKVQPESENAPPVAVHEPMALAEEPALPVEAGEETQGVKTPSDWRKGALLNVRNQGDAYVITLYPEESDARYPERELRFTNLGECQGFVSDWYSRESHDPRAR